MILEGYKDEPKGMSIFIVENKSAYENPDH